MNTYTVCIIADSQKPENFMTCLGSLYDCEDSPQDIVVIFNPWTDKFDPFIEELSFINCIKFPKRRPLNTIRKFVCQVFDSDYFIFLQDDCTIRDKGFFSILDNTVNTSCQDIVFLTEGYSSFCIDRYRAIDSFFDMKYQGYGYESIDLQFKFNNHNGPHGFGRTEPYLVHHHRQELDPSLITDKELALNLDMLCRKYNMKMPTVNPRSIVYNNEWWEKFTNYYTDFYIG